MNTISSKPSKSGPVPASAMRRAAALAPHYSVAVQAVDGGWLAKCIEMPSAFATADSPEAAVKAVRKPIALMLGTLIELGRPLPAPLSEGKRDSQVNVKLTAEERLVLESAAKHSGFKGLSDFFRFAALSAARSVA